MKLLDAREQDMGEKNFSLPNLILEFKFFHDQTVRNLKLHFFLGRTANNETRCISCVIHSATIKKISILQVE